MTNRQRFLETGALTAATAAVAWMLHSVPSWRDAHAAPSLLATLAAAGTVAFFWMRLWLWLKRRPPSPVAKSPAAQDPAVSAGRQRAALDEARMKVLKPGGAEREKTYRATPHSQLAAERFVLAAFLGGMPVVYFAQYLATDGNAQPGGWLWLELAGILIFVTLAVLGLKTSPWFLVIGIVAHGLGWDSWHYRNSPYIADWYSTGCLLVDITIGAYAALLFSRTAES